MMGKSGFSAYAVKKNAHAKPKSGMGIDSEVLGLWRDNFRSLSAFRALGYFEFNRLAVRKISVAVTFNGGEVNENIFAPWLRGYEPITLRSIKPFYCAFHLWITNLCKSIFEATLSEPSEYK